MSGKTAASSIKLPQTAKIDGDVDHETGPWALVGRQTQSRTSGLWLSHCVKSLSSFPGSASVLVSCSHSGGDLYLEGVTCPGPQCYMPFIAGCGDCIPILIANPWY